MIAKKIAKGKKKCLCVKCTVRAAAAKKLRIPYLWAFFLGHCCFWGFFWGNL
jgi:hypothetical protein